MRIVYPLTFIALIILPFFSFGETPQVSIYSKADENQYGQTFNRSSLLSMDLEDFRKSEPADTEAGGIQTAVIVDARVKNALDSLLDKKEFIFIENSVLRRLDAGGSPAYGFNWNEYGFEIVFTLEKSDEKLTEIIESTYSNDAYLLGELRRNYSDNFIVKIHRAENLFEEGSRRIDFTEAMLAATVIGDSFQPLYGIHDGLGVLDEIGIITARIDLVTEGTLVEYRQYEKADNELRSFIFSINGMQGDFVDNLFSTVNSIFGKHADDGRILLPEDFFLLKKGDNTDYAMFYYDVLKRAGYKVRFIVIDPGDSDGQLFTTVLFQERGTDLWGRIDGQVLEREIADRLGRIPALVFSGSVKYFEPEIDSILETSAFELPPPSKWRTSLY